MTGILIVTHRQLGTALIDSAEMILGNRPDCIASVSTASVNPDDLRSKIEDGIRSVNRKNGVLILTDMFGGTPCNIGCSFLEEGKVDVISAANLPIFLKAVQSRETMNFMELSKCVEAYGKKSIALASGILKGIRRSPAASCPFGSECGTAL